MKWFATITGVAATAAGVFALGAVAAAPETPDFEESVVSVAPADEEIQFGETVIYEEVAAHPADVSGIDPSISSVLSESGYTEFVGRDELAGDLPPEVLELLIANNAVLVVPSVKDTP